MRRGARGRAYTQVGFHWQILISPYISYPNILQCASLEHATHHQSYPPLSAYVYNPSELSMFSDRFIGVCVYEHICLVVSLIKTSFFELPALWITRPQQLHFLFFKIGTRLTVFIGVYWLINCCGSMGCWAAWRYRIMDVCSPQHITCTDRFFVHPGAGVDLPHICSGLRAVCLFSTQLIENIWSDMASYWIIWNEQMRQT